MALLAAFSQMGLILRVDMPQQALEVAKIFFRNSTPANESAVSRFKKTRQHFNYAIILLNASEVLRF